MSNLLTIYDVFGVYDSIDSDRKFSFGMGYEIFLSRKIMEQISRVGCVSFY